MNNLPEILPVADQVKYWDQVSKNYKESVITPFYNQDSIDSFSKEISLMSNGNFKNKFINSPAIKFIILDCGCGNGYMFPVLEDIFSQNMIKNSFRIIGTDFSRAMIFNANDHISSNSHSNLLALADQSFLPFSSKSFNIVTSINSFLETELAKRTYMFEEALRVLTENGLFIGLFPSTENHLEQAYEIKQRKIKKGIDETTALFSTYDEMVERRFDPVGGFIDVKDSDIRIKLFSEYELDDILTETGFKNIKIKKYYYPRSLVEDFGITARKDNIFDWMVSAEK